MKKNCCEKEYKCLCDGAADNCRFGKSKNKKKKCEFWEKEICNNEIARFYASAINDESEN